ncbi:MAG: GtrA family protein [Tannerellaceae bacterium]|nr:GtrA family protein [Tannerellaceae bacterium]
METIKQAIKYGVVEQLTFHSSRGWWCSAVRFGVVFVVCYLLQFCLLLTLKKNFPGVDSYYFHLTGMVFYTIINFFINKYYTFRK